MPLNPPGAVVPSDGRRRQIVKQVGITGHQNIPHDARPYIRLRIDQTLDDLGGSVVGITSLAGGSDQLFARAVLERNGRLHVVVPSDNYEESFSDRESADVYAFLLVRAARVERLEHSAPSEDAYLDAGRHIVDKCQHLVAVWDGKPARGKGGTADVVAYAHALRKPLTVIWPEGVER